MAKRRVLVYRCSPVDNPLLGSPDDVEFVYVDTLPRAITQLQREGFAGIFADTRDLSLIQQAGTILQADRILEMLSDGVAVVDGNLKLAWANSKFKSWCTEGSLGKSFYEALGSPEILGPDYSPFHTAARHGPVGTSLCDTTGHYLQLTVTPVRQGEVVTHYIVVGRDNTSEQQKQHKLDAIHRAGRALASLNSEELAKLDPVERIELLKSNIRKYTHDLLNYNVIEIRLLDDSTGRLEPLMAEGMSPEAAARVLHSGEKGNGITGFVAATGKSYLCPDTANDPLYIEGSSGARSSLTVPLLYHERVIGTFNVESPSEGKFNEEDQQFLEIFSREIAESLNTLDLLVAEKRGATSQSIEAVRREVAMPVDEILTSATSLLDRYIGHDPQMAEKLKTILASARTVKQCIEKIGESLAPGSTDSQRDGQPSRMKGLRVLVIDNDERVRRTAHGLLERHGCVVETARDATEATAMARQGCYDAFLADIRLPDMNGIEIFHKLREIQPEAHVTLMSGFGYDPSHSIIKARQEGTLRGVLYKPFRMDQLIDVLENLPPRGCQPVATSTPALAT